MEHIDKVYHLDKLLGAARHPVSMKNLTERLECSDSTVRRVIKTLLNRFNAPLEYDTQRNGWHYRKDAGTFSLPGFWLNDQEIYALLAMQQLLGKFDPELLHDEIAPIEARLREILDKSLGQGNRASLADVIRLLPYNRREHQYAHFQTIASACLQRRQLRLTYRHRSSDASQPRIVSPQRLIYYRDNWYLGAYCHHENRLHPFSLDRISDVQALDSDSLEIMVDEVETVFFSTFGIFSGRVQGVAVLRFTPQAARWVEGVIWHEQQRSGWQVDGTFELRVPYSDPTELVGEILRFGDGVTVLEPPELRERVCEKLRKTLRNYAGLVTV
jgi:predicted DNA-binding transcriptional regulator YafY